jgi:hypothetical protein
MTVTTDLRKIKADIGELVAVHERGSDLSAQPPGTPPDLGGLLGISFFTGQSVLCELRRARTPADRYLTPP